MPSPFDSSQREDKIYALEIALSLITLLWAICLSRSWVKIAEALLAMKKFGTMIFYDGLVYPTFISLRMIS